MLSLSAEILTCSVLSLSAFLKCPIRPLTAVTGHCSNRQYCHYSYIQSIVTVTTLENPVLEQGSHRALIAVDECTE